MWLLLLCCVCVGTFPTIRAQISRQRNVDLLPVTCTALPNRIHGGEETDLGEFPWLAALMYRSAKGQIALLCGGALINQRYVLTAAHCLVTTSSAATLIAVRLGEHDTNSETDCLPDGTCSHQPLDFGVQEILVHPDYSSSARNQFNDIGLIRLDSDAPITDYIKPVCLPLDEPMNKFYKERLVTAGWGATETAPRSPVKLKVSLPVMDLETCRQLYSEVGQPIGTSQICAGGDSGQDSCRGDSGGPLISLNKDDGRAVLAGVASYGNTVCGKAGWPGVYTRVSHFLSWVLNSLRP